MKVGDLVKRKSFSIGEVKDTFHGIITKVYESPVKTTVEVMWFAGEKFKASYCTIEPYFLEKLS